jgi:cytochrome o ubiquinol oxidase subunit II
MTEMKKAQLSRRIAAMFMLLVFAVVSAGCSDKLIVLDPKGPIGEQQRDLIFISTILCLIIVVPVLLLTAFIVWRYRDKKGNKAKYKPEWEHSTKLEIIWWGVPIIIILILGAITIRYTHVLEPSKPIASEEKTLTIQVTSLDWKWLFKYPDQDIATVNYVQFPEGVPVRFELTSDAPMNSFWIPQLGGQIYTMSGMAMTLHLQADKPGEYFGSGANFSGRDFAKMKFIAKATSKEEFDNWVKDIKAKSPALTMAGYNELAKQGTSEKQYFSSFPHGLFEQIVNKYSASHNHGLLPKEVESGSKDGVKGGTVDGSTSNDSHQSGHHHHE